MFCSNCALFSLQIRLLIEVSFFIFFSFLYNCNCIPCRENKNQSILLCHSYSSHRVFSCASPAEKCLIIMHVPRWRPMMLWGSQEKGSSEELFFAILQQPWMKVQKPSFGVGGFQCGRCTADCARDHLPLAPSLSPSPPSPSLIPSFPSYGWPFSSNRTVKNAALSKLLGHRKDD